MNKDCTELRLIIEELIADIEKNKTICCDLRELNPTFEQVSEESWQKKEATLWIHGATQISESNELERWLYAEPPLSVTAKSQAMEHYEEWKEYLLEGGEYHEFVETDLPSPSENESLIQFVIRLSLIIEEKGWGSKKRKRATKCFLNYLRNSNKQVEVAFIEHIFPLKNDLCGGRIIRIIRPQVFPISQEITSLIIKELAYQCLRGRQNAQHHAGEALALIWLSLISARIRWQRSLEQVHAIRYDAILNDTGYPELLAPSFFGSHRVRMGERIARFLKAIAAIPSKEPRETILQTPLPDLRKPLNTALKKLNLSPSLGEITFLTFLSPPHHFGANIRSGHK